MIDYDKLKIAHELADKLAKTEKRAVTISVCSWTYGEDPGYQYNIFGCKENGYKTIDELITKLRELTEPEPVEPGYISEILEEVKPINGVLTLPAGDYIIKDNITYKATKIDKPEELTQPEPKYKTGDVLYWKHASDSICTLKVTTIKWYEEDQKFGYLDHGQPIFEDYLYPTKAALIEAQIEYWQKLKLESMTPPFEGEATGFNGAFKVCVGCKEPVSCCDCDIQRHQDQVDIDRCQHESDGYFYKENRKSSVPYNCDGFPDMKCTKCGEFYR